jgi:homoserine kinase type II
MAVYTKLSKADISEFLSEFEVGKLTSFKGIEEGIENTNYLIQTPAEKFILTVFEKRTKAEDVPYFMKLTEWLSDRGIPCPRPIHRKDGRVIGEVAGKPAVLVQFLEGQGRPNVTHYHIRQLGALVANLHLAATDFPMERPNALSLSGWQELFTRVEKKADSITPGLAKLMGDEIDFLAKNWPKDLPAGTVHTDLFPDNVFFKRDDLSGVIDFYFSCRDFWMYDLLICLNAWCFNGLHQFVPARARILLQSYHGVRLILPEERAVIPVLGRGAALRFLLTRTYDWLHRDAGAVVTPKDPLEYVAKLKFYHERNPLSPL